LRVFEKRVLRRIFGPEGEEVAEGWRKLHNEHHHNLYSSLNIVRMRCAGHVARMGEMRNALESMKGRDHLEELGVVDGRIILKLILGNWGWNM
jgi:hypothetical protein